MGQTATHNKNLNIQYSETDNDIVLPLIADESGKWQVIIEFNGTWVRLGIEVTEGLNVVIPNVLNERYCHEIELLNSSKQIVNDTRYRLIYTDEDQSVVEEIPLSRRQEIANYLRNFLRECNVSNDTNVVNACSHLGEAVLYLNKANAEPQTKV